ncbi:MAG TPA: type II secretion system F family protein, partial [Patescibacteria group bacterium]|nr:type II secretion system F family protein [Patescibacteria group bacterium]
MAIFRYKATNKAGKKVQDMINAYNKRAALEKLKRRGLKNISLTNKTDSLEFKILVLINRVTTKDLVAFSRQFAVMISANLPMVQSLRIVAEQTKNFTLKVVLSQVAQEVDSGARLSESLAKRPKVFSKFYVNIVRSGETSGKLDEVLTYLADEMERNYDMISKIRGAMIYPAVVFVGLIGIGIFMMIFVVPSLTEMLVNSGAELPLSTRIVIGISDFLTGYWWVLLIGLILAVIAFKMIKNTELGGYYIDRIKLKLPVFGKLYHYIYIVHFSRSMATLISGGVQVTRSLEIVKDVINNRIYHDLIEEASGKVKEGDTIS